MELTALHEALVVILLHSETSSEHRGSSYVLSINGARILQSDEMGDNGIPIEIPGVLKVVLLKGTALGGGAGTAGVGTVTTGGNPAETAGVVNTSSDGGPLVASAASGATPATGGVARATAAAPGAATGGAAVGHLHAPTTGVSLGSGGFVLVVVGTWLVLLTLRRRRGAC